MSKQERNRKTPKGKEKEADPKPVPPRKVDPKLRRMVQGKAEPKKIE
jgi:hypothetical protein